MTKRFQIAALVVLAMTVACGDDVSDEDVVARVGNYVLTVDETVDLLVDEERLTAEAEVVESLAELWIDYVLLAEAAARDTMFSDLDLEPLVMQQIQQMMVFQLRDSVIQVDTFITDDELRAQYEAQAPAVELNASHIMLRLPLQATQAQRDSVVAEVDALRARIAAGASFEAMAAQFSQDPGTAMRGGDLGFFSRGDMVAPFEAAALALSPGELSDVVETPMGLHLIRLNERRVRGFDDAAPQYRNEIQTRMVVVAESLFVTALVARAAPTMADGALDVVREMAENPGTSLSGRAARRELLDWAGGAVTVGDVQEVMQLEAAPFREAVASWTDEEVTEFLEGIARRHLLIREAQASGLQPERDSIDVLINGAKGQLRGAARMLGLLDLDRAPGEALEIAIARVTEEALRDNLSGAKQIVPLGLVSFQLREGRSISIHESGVGQVIIDVATMRATRSLSPLEQTLDSALANPDTIGP